MNDLRWFVMLLREANELDAAGEVAQADAMAGIARRGLALRPWWLRWSVRLLHAVGWEP